MECPSASRGAQRRVIGLWWRRRGRLDDTGSVSLLERAPQRRGARFHGSRWQGVGASCYDDRAMPFEVAKSEVIIGVCVLLAVYALAMAAWLIGRRRRRRPADINPRSRKW